MSAGRFYRGCDVARIEGRQHACDLQSAVSLCASCAAYLRGHPDMRGLRDAKAEADRPAQRSGLSASGAVRK